MIKLIDLNYHMHVDLADPSKVMELQKASIGFVKFIKKKLDITLVKHMNYEGEKTVHNILCNFFKCKNSFFAVPIKTHRFIKKQQADIILIQGLIFPIQVITLRILTLKKVKFIVQHHGERPYDGIKRLFQKIADKFIHAYLFTNIENANEWIENGIISSKEKCHEVLEASTYFTQKDKQESKLQLGMTGNENFLWVGRLNKGKDPLTVIRAFEKFITIHRDAKLYMIYQTNELLTDIEKELDKNKSLKNSIYLQGKVAHYDLETWYSAADFYISASHKEGSGYALIEAMSCGCIPVVTNIPSFRKITADGKYGFLFEPGSSDSLLASLLKLDDVNITGLSCSVVKHFKNSLSFQSIADGLYDICKNIITK